MQSLSIFRSLVAKRAPSLLLRQQRAISPITRVSPTSFRAPVQSFAGRRWNSSLTVPESEARKQKEEHREPSYQLTFTCKPCGHRSKHFVTKHGYHKGTVLVKCPSCSNRHLISDHLKIFSDKAVTLEDILQQAAGGGKDLGKLLKKGKLGMRQGELIAREGDEDIEFWEDGTETDYQTPQATTQATP